MLGDTSSTAPEPSDPLMRESVEPRYGIHPSTGQELAPPGSKSLQNSINGHEWNIHDQSALQYACIFPIEPRACLTKQEAAAARDQGQRVAACACTNYPNEEFGNPLCQDEAGIFDQTQRHAAAYPAVRQLRVLEAYGDNAIVASICPKSTDMTRADAGYRPAVNALFERLREALD
jgi:hypothetical protein